MAPSIEIQLAADEADEPPEPGQLRRWAEAALAALGRTDVALTVRVVGEEEGRVLNRDYRGRDHPTNVLSFAFDETPPEARAELGATYLGDLAVCAPVVAREAREQGKPAAAHWAHMVVHGVLHLLGHDHHEPAAAAAMESRERSILATLGYADPYDTVREDRASARGVTHG